MRLFDLASRDIDLVTGLRECMLCVFERAQRNEDSSKRGDSEHDRRQCGRVYFFCKHKRREHADRIRCGTLGRSSNRLPHWGSTTWGLAGVWTPDEPREAFTAGWMAGHKHQRDRHS